MKTKLIIGSVAAVCCICLLAADSNKFIIVEGYSATNFIRSIEITNFVLQSSKLYAKADNGAIVPITEDGRTNLVNSLIASGEFCRIHGHAWVPHVHVTLEYNPTKIGCRQCAICGLHQTQYATEWK